MILDFLNFNEARYDFTNSCYLNRFNAEELRIRLSLVTGNQVPASIRNDACKMRELLQQIYINSCRDFQPEEQSMVSFLFQMIDKIVSRRTEGRLFLPDSFQVKLIKLDSRGRRLDWGFLFTINEAIVLPDNYLNDMAKTYDRFLVTAQEMAQANNAAIQQFPNYQMLRPYLVNLYHEVIHLLQRSTKMSGIYQRIFEDIYQRTWGFIKITPDKITNLSPNDNFISNPDGDNFEWIIGLYNYQTKSTHYFLPTLVYDYQRKIPVGVLIELKPNGNGVNRCYTLLKRWDRIEKFPVYTKRFYGLSEQLYHPNEILAQLLSEYLVGDKIFTNDPDSFYFYDAINKFLLKPCLGAI